MMEDILLWLSSLFIFLRGVDRYGRPMISPYEAATLGAQLRRHSKSSRLAVFIDKPDNHTAEAERLETLMLAVIRSRIQECKNVDQDELAIILGKLLDRQ